MSSSRIMGLTRDSSVAAVESKNIPELRICERVTQSAANLFGQAKAYAGKEVGKAYSVGSQVLSSFAEWALQKTDIIHGVSYWNLPHLKGGVLGQLPAFRDPKGLEWQKMIDEATKLADAHPSKMCYFWIGPYRALVVASKERSAEILHKLKPSMHGGDSLGIFDFCGKKALLNLKESHEYYAKQRNFYLKQFFSSEALKKLKPQIEEIVKKHVDEIKIINDVSEFSVSLAMDVVARTQLGFKDFEEEDRRKISKFIEKIIPRVVANKVRMPWESDQVKSILLEGRIYFREIIKKNMEFILADDSDNALKKFIVGGGIAMWGSNPPSRKELTKEEMQDRLINDEDVLDLAITIAVVGHETTSNLIKAVAILLAHPVNHSVQEKLRAEFNNERKESKQPVESKSILGKPKDYAEKVLFEALRLYTVIPTFKEMPEKDCELEGGYRLPKGTMVYMPNSFIHRNIKDGDTFNPDREQSYMNNNCGFIPFGIPPRTCPGRDFSLLEAKLLLEALVTQFKLECDPDAVSKTSKMINIHFDSNIQIRLHPLNNIIKQEEQLDKSGLEVDGSDLRLRMR
jgi:cytochrome P450